MAVRLDPEQNESKILLDFLGEGSLGAVLEIGCGDGRLTRCYAGRAVELTGIDPNQDRIAKAIQDVAVEIKDKVRFLALGLEEYALAYPEEVSQYDLCIFSWSL